MQRYSVSCLSAFMQTLNFEKEKRAAKTGNSWAHSVPDGSGSPPSGPPVTSVIPSWIQSVCQPIDQPARTHTERWDAGVSGLHLPHLCVWALTWTLSPVGKPSNWSIKVVLQRKRGTDTRMTTGQVTSPEAVHYTQTGSELHRAQTSNTSFTSALMSLTLQHNSTHHLAVGPDSTPLCCPATHSKRTRYRPSVFRRL